MTKLVKLFAILCGLALIAYIGFCATVYFLPELFFYHPSKDVPNIEIAKQNGYDAQEIKYTSSDGTELVGWYTAPVTHNAVVVYMHGNSGNIETFYHKLKPLADAGYGTFIGEYRGFGGVKGRITEKNLKEDALAAVNYLKSIGYENSNIYLYGMSLGSHMAINTAYQLKDDGDFAGLILEVPLDDLPSVVADHVKFPLPLNAIIREKYNSIDLIGQLNTRILFQAAGQDTTVDSYHAQRLYDAANEPKIMLFFSNARHDNLFDYGNYETIIKWL